MWPHHGRMRRSQSRSAPASRHSARLIAGLTKMRATMGLRAAASSSLRCCGRQTSGSTSSPFAATTLVAGISSRSAALSRRSGIGVSHRSASSPIWCEACPVSIGPPRGWPISPTRRPGQPAPSRRRDGEPLEKPDQHRMAPGAIARRPHHLPVRAVGRQRRRAGKAALRVAPDRHGAGPGGRARRQPEHPLCGVLRQPSQHRSAVRGLLRGA